MQALIIIEANGKAQAWARIARKLDMDARVLATTGHVCSFPERLNPIGISLEKGEIFETRRAAIPAKREMILAAVAGLPKGTAIVIATDDDVEGDVIAYDVADIILTAFPDRESKIVRVRPGPITVHGIRSSLAGAKPLRRCLPSMTTDAIPGRARAVTDRWIGATFSRIAGIPVGRVRSAIIGATWMLKNAPARLRGLPETGEITLQARSASGGRPFVAYVRLTGSEDPGFVERISSLAKRWSPRVIPGIVRPLQPAGAAIAPREGTVRPFNTADALVHAARHHQIPVKMAMQGLQDAYHQGMISYPRTEGRDMSDESATRVTMLGFGCGLEGLAVDVLSNEQRLSTIEGRPAAHEGLHPVMPLSTGNTEQLRELIRRPVRVPAEGWDRAGVMQVMTVLVARRAFEASREIFLERGNWSPDNGSQDIAPEEVELLRDLEWVRDTGFSFPWTRNNMTGQRSWPMDSVLLEIMVIEGLGRPSSFTAHVETALKSGDIEEADFPDPPRPSPQGVETLRRTPRPVWNPAVCRLIEDVLENAGNRFGEDERSPLAMRARHRVLSWLRRIPEDMRIPLLEALKEGSAQREKGIGGLMAAPAQTVAQSAAASPSSDGGDTPSPFEIPSEPADPTPFETT